MGNINLDDRRAVRAAEREKKGESPTFTHAGETFDLPVEMPFAAVENVALAEMGVLSAVPKAFKELLGNDGYDRLMATEPRPTFDDMYELMKGVMVEYGFREAEEGDEGVGESPASES